MPIRKSSSRSRSVRPGAEALEDRKLLAASLSGVDSDGDTWTLRLVGPGSIRVVKQPGADGDPIPLDTPGQIDEITIAGTQPLSSKLLGTVRKAANGDGKVFFQTMTGLSSRSLQSNEGNGLLAINMPDFWLGFTGAVAPTTAGAERPSINLPDGVSTLRLGGADVTAFFGTNPNQGLGQNGQDDQFQINLGIPQFFGTRIIVDSLISNAQAASTPTGAATQDGISISVDGRISLFQANSIQGNTTLPPGSFARRGGVFLESQTDPLGITGQIGFLQVGGEAENFSVVTNDQISNFYIGGETNNVSVLAQAGARNVHFGRGMDTVTFLTHTIENLAVNRGALSSRVIADRGLGTIRIGGDVVNTFIQSGYVQNLNALNPTANPTVNAQAGGSFTITIAGDVTDSVLSASTEPFEGTFGGPEDLFLPHGRIRAKIEGVVNNANETPESPNRAVYAQSMKVVRGPVVPPNVPEQPLPKPGVPTSVPGIGNLGQKPRLRNRHS